MHVMQRADSRIENGRPRLSSAPRKVQVPACAKEKALMNGSCSSGYVARVPQGLLRFLLVSIANEVCDNGSVNYQRPRDRLDIYSLLSIATRHPA